MNVLVIFDGKSETVLLVLKFNKISWNLSTLGERKIEQLPLAYFYFIFFQTYFSLSSNKISEFLDFQFIAIILW